MKFLTSLLALFLLCLGLLGCGSKAKSANEINATAKYYVLITNEAKSRYLASGANARAFDVMTESDRYNSILKYYPLPPGDTQGTLRPVKEEISKSLGNDTILIVGDSKTDPDIALNGLPSIHFNKH